MQRSTERRQQLQATNTASAARRRSLVSRPEAVSAVSTLGAEFVERALVRSGVAAMTIGLNDDIKCMHAVLADWLCRVRNAPSHLTVNPACASVLGQTVASATAAHLQQQQQQQQQQLGEDEAISEAPGRSLSLNQKHPEIEALLLLRGEGLRCWTACDPSHKARDGDYAYHAKKNNIMLMHRRRRRKQHRAQVLAKQAAE